MNTGDVIFASIFIIMVIMGIVNIKIIFDAAARDVACAGKAFASYFFQVMGLYGIYFAVHFFFYRFNCFNHSVFMLALFLLASFRGWLELVEVNSKD